ncbi:MAG: histidine phosphatase family protein [Rhodobacterales bacterium]|nr:histidine phosphatase family protein [Rhodobacterales bacterium]NCT12263.1 histidine phosphatase family protein [Rhodobacterales bacterium]
MTLTLILIRHAKSSWANAGQDDHARPLNPRGRTDAPRVGAWLAAQGHIPDLVLCSDAARTRETLALILPALPRNPQVSHHAALYHAAPQTMLDILHGADSPCVAMVGHNPGIGALAAGLLTTSPDHPRFADYPTAATTVMTFAAPEWRAVTPGTGTLLGFTIPHDLAD